MQKATKHDPPLQFKDEGEVREFERQIRLAHAQFVEEDPKPVLENPIWLGRKAPGIKKRLLGKFFPPRSHHMKGK